MRMNSQPQPQPDAPAPTVPEPYLRFRDGLSFDAISLGYRMLALFRTDELVDQHGRALRSARLTDVWPGHWLVVGNDDMGDPLAVDVGDPSLAVFTALRMEEDLAQEYVAGSLQQFGAILRMLERFSRGREFPAGLERNPFTEDEKDDFLRFVEHNSPPEAARYWEIWI